MDRMDLFRPAADAVLEGIACVAELRRGTTRQGKEYLGLKLRNRTGEIGGRIWQEQMPVWSGIEVGRGVYIRASAKAGWNGGPPELGAVQSVEALEAGHPIERELNPVCPVPIGTLMEHFDAIVDRIERPGVRALVDAVLSKAGMDLFQSVPAATHYHHNYVHGLLEHSVEVARLALSIADTDRFRDWIDHDLLIAGALLHDVGKTVEYQIGVPGTDGEAGLSTSERGRLVHHTILGPMMVQCVISTEWARLKEAGLTARQVHVLVHMMVSHHGTREWGSVVEPLCPEAQIVHLADLCSARLRSMLDQAERHGPDERGWVLKPDRPQRLPLLFPRTDLPGRPAGDTAAP